MGWLLIAGLALLGFSFMRRQRAYPAAAANYHSHQQDQIFSNMPGGGYQPQSYAQPADFNEQDFFT